MRAAASPHVYADITLRYYADIHYAEILLLLLR